MVERTSLLNWLGAEHGTALLDILLGEYTFHDGIKLYHGSGVVHQDVSLTELHETVHLHLCVLTSFGVFQRFLARLISHPSTPEAYRNAGERALPSSIAASWCAHEGAATYVEFILFLLKNGPDRAPDFLATLPDKYRRAVMVYVRVLWSLRLPLAWHGPLCEGMAHVALTTRILEDMRDPHTFSATDFAEYLSVAQDRVPDERLSIIASALEHEDARYQLRDQVKAKLQTIFGTRSLQRQFDAYCDLPVERRKSVNDALREASISLCSARVPFETLTDEQVHALEQALWDSWARSLPNMAPRNASRCPSPSEAPFHTQLRYILDQLDYVPSDATFGDTLIVPFDARRHVLAFTEASGCRLYVHVRHNPTPHNIGPESLPVPPLGAYVVLQAWDPTDEERPYSFPMTGVPNQYRNAACMICCDQKQLNLLLAELETVDHVRSLPQWPGERWRPIGCPEALASALHPPLFVIVSASTSRRWSDTLRDIDRSADHWICYGADDAPAEARKLFLLLGRSDGTVVWGRPTSSLVYEWLQGGEILPPAVKALPVVPRDYPAGWEERLDVACDHYLLMGW